MLLLVQIDAHQGACLDQLALQCSPQGSYANRLLGLMLLRLFLNEHGGCTVWGRSCIRDMCQNHGLCLRHAMHACRQFWRFQHGILAIYDLNLHFFQLLRIKWCISHGPGVDIEDLLLD
jgi:hypothetical protein